MRKMTSPDHSTLLIKQVLSYSVAIMFNYSGSKGFGGTTWPQQSNLLTQLQLEEIQPGLVLQRAALARGVIKLY